MMGPIAAVESVVFKYFKISGRATRAEFWWWTLFTIILFAGCGFMDAASIQASIENDVEFSLSPFSYALFNFWLFTYIPTVTVAIRRLHDSGHSGFWYLILFVPLVGAIWFFVLMVFPSERNDNIYGPIHRRDISKKAAAAGAHDPMQGYAVLDRLHEKPTEEMRAARKQEVRDYYRARVLQTQ